MRSRYQHHVQYVLLIGALALPLAQPAAAIDIHYAGAIGDPYEYHPPTAGTKQASEPSQSADAPNASLPGLGTESSAPATKAE